MPRFDAYSVLVIAALASLALISCDSEELPVLVDDPRMIKYAWDHTTGLRRTRVGDPETVFAIYSTVSRIGEIESDMSGFSNAAGPALFYAFKGQYRMPTISRDASEELIAGHDTHSGWLIVVLDSRNGDKIWSRLGPSSLANPDEQEIDIPPDFTSIAYNRSELFPYFDAP